MSPRVLLVLLAACATATSPREQPSDGSTTSRDAPVSHLDGSLADAPVLHDASVLSDASLSADAGNPPFCTDNTQFIVQGTCCFVALCVPGTAVGANLCFPS